MYIYKWQIIQTSTFQMCTWTHHSLKFKIQLTAVTVFKRSHCFGLIRIRIFFFKKRIITFRLMTDFLIRVLHYKNILHEWIHCVNCAECLPILRKDDNSSRSTVYTYLYEEDMQWLKLNTTCKFSISVILSTTFQH